MALHAGLSLVGVGHLRALRSVPAAIVNKLHQDFRTVMTSPEGRAYQATRPSIDVYYTPDEMRTFVVNEYERFKKIAQMAGIKPK